MMKWLRGEGGLSVKEERAAEAIREDYFISGDLLYYKNAIYVPKTKKVISINIFDDKVITTRVSIRNYLALHYHWNICLHGNTKRVVELLSDAGWNWPDMVSDVADVINHCQRCNRWHKKEDPLMYGFERRPPHVYCVIHVDHMVGLPPSEPINGTIYKGIIVYMCKLTSTSWLVPCSGYTMRETYNRLWDRVIPESGIPERIRGDHAFKPLQDYFHEDGFQVPFRSDTPYNRRAGEQVERLMKDKQFLFKTLKNQGKSWPTIVPMLQLLSRNRPRSHHGGLSPNEMLLGRRTRTSAHSQSFHPGSDLPTERTNYDARKLEDLRSLLAPLAEVQHEKSAVTVARKKGFSITSSLQIGDFVLFRNSDKVTSRLDYGPGISTQPTEPGREDPEPGSLFQILDVRGNTAVVNKINPEKINVTYASGDPEFDKEAIPAGDVRNYSLRHLIKVYMNKLLAWIDHDGQNGVESTEHNGADSTKVLVHALNLWTGQLLVSTRPRNKRNTTYRTNMREVPRSTIEFPAGFSIEI